MKGRKFLRFTTAGYSETDRLSADPGPCRCGDVIGIAFWHDNGGGWVLSYEDFDKLVAAVSKVRQAK